MIPMNVHVLGAPEARAAAQVIRSGWLAQGPEVLAFEGEFAARVGADFACVVSSGSAAFHLALVAVGVVAGDEVLVPANAHSVCTSAVLRCGATPIFVALDAASENMDPSAAAAMITKSTSAVLCCHNYGMPCDLSRILALADAARIPVVEDAVAAIGSQILVGDRWSAIGAPHGTVACFGFHPGSIISTGGGGVLTTSHAHIDKAVRAGREQEPLHLEDCTPRSGGGAALDSQAYDYRLSDIQASIGREQLKRLDTIVAARRALAARYRIFLTGVDVMCPEEPAWARSNWQGYVVTLPEDVSRERVMQEMARHGVATRPGATASRHFDEAEPVRAPDSSNGTRHPAHRHDLRLVLPLYPSMSERLQRRVCGVVALALIAARSL